MLAYKGSVHTVPHLKLLLQLAVLSPQLLELCRCPLLRAAARLQLVPQLLHLGIQPVMHSSVSTVAQDQLNNTFIH